LEEERRKLIDGARQIECLKLRTLVLVGSYSHQFYGDPGHKRKIKRLFTPAVGGGGKIEFLDRQYAPLWLWNLGFRKGVTKSSNRFDVC
jgi:hypothetical protein